MASISRTTTVAVPPLTAVLLATNFRPPLSACAGSSSHTDTRHGSPNGRYVNLPTPGFSKMAGERRARSLATSPPTAPGGRAGDGTYSGMSLAKPVQFCPGETASPAPPFLTPASAFDLSTSRIVHFIGIRSSPACSLSLHPSSDYRRRFPSVDSRLGTSVFQRDRGPGKFASSTLNRYMFRLFVDIRLGQS